MAKRLGDFEHLLGVPIFLVSQQGPGQDGDLSGQSNGGLLLASLLLARDAVINTFRPSVVTQRHPGTFDKNRSRQWIAPLGNSSVAIRLAGLILTGHEAEVGGDLATVLEAMWIIDTGHEDFSRPRPDTGNSANALDARVVFADRLELLDDDVHLHGQRIQLCQFQIQFTSPELIRIAIGKWLTIGVDAISPSMPSFIARVDRDAMIDEPSFNGALHLIDAAIKRLTILDQRAKLAVSFGRHVDGFQFFQGRHSSQLERIIFVSFAFDVGPFPSVLIRRAYQRLVAEADGQVVDPAGGAAGFHDDEVDFVRFKDRFEVTPLGGRVKERMLPRFRVKKAAHGIELAEIQSENFHRWLSCGFGVGCL